MRNTKRLKNKSRPDISKSDLGEAARQIICGRLLINGIKVFMPLTEDTPIDLLVLTEKGNIYKCQCKYIFPCSSNDSHTFQFFSTRTNNIQKKAYNHVYTSDEVDYFLGYCLDNDSIYIIPQCDTDGKRRVQLWILRDPLNNQKSNVFDHEKYINNFDLLKDKKKRF